MDTNILLDENHPIIPFTSDYGFKVTFGNENNTLFLRKALQALIASPIPIKEVTFDKNTFDGITRESRSGVFDMSCIDEMNNHFIVEMQLSLFKFFMQRLKFYGLQKLNTMVQKGQYIYADLNKIYCIAIMSHSISELPHYHNIGTMKNQDGILMDDQMTFITIELDKFNKTAETCTTDLDKLIFTMKEAHVVNEPTQFPQFWTEEWLKVAIAELDTRRMTPEERMAYVMTLSNNAIALHMENQRKEEAVKEATEIVKRETTEIVKRETTEIMKRENISKALKRGKLSDAEIAEDNGVSIEYVKALKQELT
jgi:predicted transposase/invertase (TIGR01784 family)